MPSSCRSIESPPYTDSTFTPRPLPSSTISAATWRASSRVGASTTAWTDSFAGSILSTMGMPKAAVFPVPVRDWTTRSLPAIASGIVSAWTPVGAV